MSELKINKMNVLIFILGISSSWPFFLIPMPNFIYLNRILSVTEDYVVHPSYTFSLGPALPACILGLLVMSVLCFLKGEIYIKKTDSVVFMILSTSVYLLLASESIKSLAFSASLFSIYIILKLSESKLGILFLKSYFSGLALFVILHALSLALNGYEFSRKTNGISIFSIEIYQGLVSYAAVIAVMFGSLLMRRRLSDLIVPNIDSNKIKFIYLTLLISLLYIEFFVTRRAGFILITLAIFMATYRRFSETKFKRWSIGLSIGLIYLLYYFSATYLYTGLKSLNWTEMIEPRLKLYQATLYGFYSSDLLGILFGTQNDWATKHNTYFDILYHSGLVGLFTSFLCLYFLGYLYIKRFERLRLRMNRLYIFFILFAILFDNFVNAIFSTPYYTVCVFSMLTIFWNADTCNRLRPEL